MCRWLQFPPADLPVLIFSPLSLTAVLYALCFISKTSQSLIQNICALLREKARFSALVCLNAPFEQVWAKSHIKTPCLYSTTAFQLKQRSKSVAHPSVQERSLPSFIISKPSELYNKIKTGADWITWEMGENCQLSIKRIALARLTFTTFTHIFRFHYITTQLKFSKLFRTAPLLWRTASLHV